MSGKIIAGAGIAGLTAALALAKKGVAVEIHEKRAAITDEGFGIQLSPNALHALASIGVIIKGVTPLCLKVYAPKLITEMPMGEGFLCLSRASLVEQLLSYVVKAPLIKIRLNSIAEVCDIDATGLYSRFRDDAVLESGLVARRHVEVGQLEHVEIRLASGEHSVRYPIGNGFVNCVETGVNLSPKYPIYPLKTRGLKYHTGNVMHVGDAAHGMLPMLAQGAAMAIEDAIYGANETRVLKVMRAAKFNAFAFHLPQPFAFARNVVMRATDLQKRYEWLYNFKP